MMTPDHLLTVERVAREYHDLVAALLYRYLSELGASTDYPYLHLYWQEAGRTPYLFRVGDIVAGFALVRNIERGLHEIAEFWVEPRYRRRGAGRAAALALFQAHPGEWSVASYPGNVGAELFWRNATAGFRPHIAPSHDRGASVYRFRSPADAGNTLLRESASPSAER